MADFLSSPFMKASIATMDESGWTTQSTKWEGETRSYYKLVPWLNRAVDLRCNAVADLPFDIVGPGGEIVDSSEDYTGILAWLPDPPALFASIEAALCIWNYAYLENYGRGLPALRYLFPPSVTANIDPKDGLIDFTRQLGAEQITLTKEQVLYFWKFDPYVELGQPENSPAQAAAAACGVLLNVDRFAAAFFARGAIKQTILTVAGGTQKEERDRLEEWWARVIAGIRNAWGSKVVNADKLTPVVVGEGLESLAKNELTTGEREAIATGMGIPHSILFSGAANYAVADADDRHFYSKTIIPDGRFIQGVFNTQLLKRYGYRLRFAPERLKVFQEDETQRAGALAQITTALKEPQSEIGLQILGYDLSKEQWAILRASWARAAATPPPSQFGLFASPMAQAAPQAPTPTGALSGAAGDELRAWQRKATARVKAGRPVPFDSEHIPDGLAGAIAGALESAETAADVKAIFDSVWQGYP